MKIQKLENKKVGKRVSWLKAVPSQLGLGDENVNLNIVILDCMISPNSVPNKK